MLHRVLVPTKLNWLIGNGVVVLVSSAPNVTPCVSTHQVELVDW